MKAAAVAAGAVLLVLPASAAARTGPGWSPVAQVAGLGPLPSQPALAVAPGGDGVLATVAPRFGAPGVLKVAVRSPGGAFAAPAALSAPGAAAIGFGVAVARTGEATAVWDEVDPTTGDQAVFLARRPAGGAFSAPVAVGAGQNPRVGVSAAGEAVVAWETTDADGIAADVVAHVPPGAPAPGPPAALLDASGFPVSGAALAVGADGTAAVAFRASDGTVQAMAGAPGGTFGAPARLTAPDVVAGPPSVAVDARGGAMAVWDRLVFASPESGDQPAAVQAAVRAPGGPFAPLSDVAAVDAPATAPVVAGDDMGRMTIAWRERDTVLTVTVPPGGVAGAPEAVVGDPATDEQLQAPVALSSAPDGTTVVGLDGDRSPQPGVVLAAVRPPGAGSFGPVCTVAARGGSPVLAAGSAGEVSAAWTQVSGTDEAVFASSLRAEGDTHCAEPPTLSSLRLRPASFRASRHGPSTGRRGGRVTFVLDRAARVTFTVQRLTKVAGRWKTLRGRFRRRAGAGRTGFRFTGRLHGRTLAPRYYRLVAVPRAEGVRGTAATVEFQIRR